MMKIMQKKEYHGGELDPLFDEVMDFVINTGTTSVSSIQRKFSVGFNRAARIMALLVVLVFFIRNTKL